MNNLIQRSTFFGGGTHFLVSTMRFSHWLLRTNTILSSKLVWQQTTTSKIASRFNNEMLKLAAPRVVTSNSEGLQPKETFYYLLFIVRTSSSRKPCLVWTQDLMLKKENRGATVCILINACVGVGGGRHVILSMSPLIQNPTSSNARAMEA